MTDPLLALPMTRQEERSVRLVRHLTGWDEDRALEYVRVFYWHIRAAGGAERLLRSQGIVR